MSYKDRWTQLKAALDMLEAGGKLRRPNAEWLLAIRAVKKEYARISRKGKS